MSFIKREIRYFNVVIVQQQQSKPRKGLMYLQSCCFAYLNLLLFCRWLVAVSPESLLKTPLCLVSAVAIGSQVFRSVSSYFNFVIRLDFRVAIQTHI